VKIASSRNQVIKEESEEEPKNTFANIADVIVTEA
jgi:hypothetical protein